MKRTLPLIIAAAAGLALVRSRERRASAERLAAATLESLLGAVDANDEVTGAHVRRVAAYALVLAAAAGLDERTRRSVERVALFHDIGKIDAALFDIVHDDDALTAEERRKIATHPERGAEVLAPLSAFYPDLGEGVLSHHERWDGGGYPRRLRGTQIPISARVVAIADTFDALTHTRRYHDGESASHAARVIEEGRGTQFDPALVDLFLRGDVFARVRALCQTSGDTVARPKRRRAAAEQNAPNVQFRWRDDVGLGGASSSSRAESR